MKFPYLDFQLEEIHRVLMEYAAGNYQAQAKVSPLADDIDSITCCINMMGQELYNTTTSLDYFNSIYNAVHDMLFVLHPDGSIKDINKTVQEKLNYSWENMAGKAFSSFIKVDNPRKFISFLRFALKRNNNIFFLETTISDAKGKNIPVHLSCSGILDRGGVSTGYLVVAQDISERIEAEQRTLQAMMKGEEKERHRVSYDLHDSLGQELIVLKTNLLEIEKRFAGNDNFSRKVFPDALNAMENVISQIKSISFNLMPSIFETHGIRGAVNGLIDRLRFHKIKFHFQCPKILPVSRPLEINIYRLVQEFLSNSLKHSKANNIHIRISVKNNKCLVRLRDDGVGFTISKVQSKGNGLSNIATRVRAFNGKYSFMSQKRRGTMLITEFPV